MTARAFFTDQVKVIETSSAVAMVTESPGMAPTKSPAKAPAKTSRTKTKSTWDSMETRISIGPAP